MTALRELSFEQIEQTVREAIEREVPVTLTVREDCGWANARSRLVSVEGDHLLLSTPEGPNGAPVSGMEAAAKVGLSFKLKHYKYVSTVTVAGTQDGDAGAGKLLSVCFPTSMLRMQRRAYERVAVPLNRIVRASVWLSGRDAEPSVTSPEHPVWSGTVTNLSAGGFQLRTTQEATRFLEVGDIVGVRIVFGAAEETVYADAQFRHWEPGDGDGGLALMGFQFIGLAQSHEGLEVIQFLNRKIREFQHAERRAHHRRQATVH